jgi:hypothetical protein
MAWVQSLTWPPVTTKSTGRPSSLASRWTLVVRPPRERPRALSAPLFCGPWPLAGGRARWSNRSSDRGSCDRPRGRRRPVPHPAGRPAAEPLMHALVLAVALGKIVPVRTGTQHPQHPVDEHAIVRRVRPTVSARPGSSSSIRVHCASLNSYRPIPINTERQIQANTQSLYVDTA